MKRIGILTFHRACNYGAVLQCYALQTLLSSLGYKSGVVDFRPDYIEKNYRFFSFQKFLHSIQHPRLAVSYIKGMSERRNRKRLFSPFAERFFKLIPFSASALPTDLDCVVIGSDQLWSINYTGGIIKTYFGEIQHRPNQKIVGYAISSNEKSLKAIGEQQLKAFVSNFDMLSFREKSIADIVCDMTGRESVVCVDPVLLTNPEMWVPVMDNTCAQERYVLVYQVHSAGGDFKNAVKYAEQIADELGCKVVDLTDGHCTPGEFVSRFKNAQFVVTTSFHGTVFSTIFHKQFVTLKVNDTVDERAKNLLSQIGLIDRMIDFDKPVPSDSVDFSVADKRLAVLRESSLDYLRNIMNL